MGIKKTKKRGLSQMEAKDQLGVGLAFSLSGGEPLQGPAGLPGNPARGARPRPAGAEPRRGVRPFCSIWLKKKKIFSPVGFTGNLSLHWKYV